MVTARTHGATRSRCQRKLWGLCHATRPRVLKGTCSGGDMSVYNGFRTVGAGHRSKFIQHVVLFNAKEATQPVRQPLSGASFTANCLRTLPRAKAVVETRLIQRLVRGMRTPADRNEQKACHFPRSFGVTGRVRDGRNSVPSAKRNRHRSEKLPGRTILGKVDALAVSWDSDALARGRLELGREWCFVAKHLPSVQNGLSDRFFQ